MTNPPPLPGGGRDEPDGSGGRGWVPPAVPGDPPWSLPGERADGNAGGGGRGDAGAGGAGRGGEGNTRAGGGGGGGGGGWYGPEGPGRAGGWGGGAGGGGAWGLSPAEEAARTIRVCLLVSAISNLVLGGLGLFGVLLAGVLTFGIGCVFVVFPLPLLVLSYFEFRRRDLLARQPIAFQRGPVTTLAIIEIAMFLFSNPVAGVCGIISLVHADKLDRA